MSFSLFRKKVISTQIITDSDKEISTKISAFFEKEEEEEGEEEKIANEKYEFIIDNPNDWHLSSFRRKLKEGLDNISEELLILTVIYNHNANVLRFLLENVFREFNKKTEISIETKIIFGIMRFLKSPNFTLFDFAEITAKLTEQSNKEALQLILIEDYKQKILVGEITTLSFAERAREEKLWRTESTPTGKFNT